jgi:tRNA(Arg) A34 adenosine deaminase TadA
VEAYCILVEPKSCNNLIKELSSCLPLEEELHHLKRARKQPISRKEVRNEDDDTRSCIPPSKRSMVMLQVLLGTRAAVSPFTSTSDVLAKTSSSSVDQQSEKIVKILSHHGSLHKVRVPKRPPQSEQEWKIFNAVWPTHYYPLKTAEYQQQQKVLSPDELKTMQRFILDAIEGQTVLIVDPELKEVVADTKGEIFARSNESCYPSSAPIVNCLTTPVLLSIQGISRLERQSQVKQLNVTDSVLDNREESKKLQHQYLCNGYDMYCYYEPSVFEAMACLHSRLRRLVYCKAGTKSSDIAVWRNGCSRHYIHDLKDTNHRFRVFEYHAS